MFLIKVCGAYVGPRGLVLHPADALNFMLGEAVIEAQRWLHATIEKENVHDSNGGTMG